MPLEHTHTRTHTCVCTHYNKIKCHSKFSGSYYATPEDEAEVKAEARLILKCIWQMPLLQLRVTFVPCECACVRVRVRVCVVMLYNL